MADSTRYLNIMGDEPYVTIGNLSDLRQYYWGYFCVKWGLWVCGGVWVCVCYTMGNMVG